MISVNYLIDTHFHTGSINDRRSHRSLLFSTYKLALAMEGLDRRVQVDCDGSEVVLPVCVEGDQPFNYRHLFRCVRDVFSDADTTPSIIFFEDNLVICCVNGNLPYCRPEIFFHDQHGSSFSVYPYKVDGRKEVSFEELFHILSIAGNKSSRAVPGFKLLPHKGCIRVR